MAHPLARIIEQLKREPSRTGSIAITVFGDAIVPRGGSVWLGTLLEFFKAIDIDSGVVRTAMSRLAADGWLERHKVGRNSFYRLVKKGRQTFDAATKHIYDPQPSDWTGRFELLLIGNGEDRDASREALKNAGFGSPLPGVWVAPSGVPVPEEAARAIRLASTSVPHVTRITRHCRSGISIPSSRPSGRLLSVCGYQLPG